VEILSIFIATKPGTAISIIFYRLSPTNIFTNIHGELFQIHYDLQTTTSSVSIPYKKPMHLSPIHPIHTP
jgi:hypothetical protein